MKFLRFAFLLAAVLMVAGVASASSARTADCWFLIGEVASPGYVCGPNTCCSGGDSGPIIDGEAVASVDGHIGAEPARGFSLLALLTSLVGAPVLGVLGMAVVTGPLMSMSASGSFGGTLVFDKRGFVRTHVIPANPQSDAQGNVRQMLLAVQKALTKLGETVITAVKTIAPVSYRWNSYLLQQVLGASSTEFAASKTAFLALSGPEQTTWDDEATDAGILTQSIEYATDDAISGGLALFAVSRALFAAGINTADGAPGAANADDWKDFYIS